MTTQRRVRLFRMGGNQAVRIPQEFELPGTEAVMRKEEGRLILESVPRRQLLQTLAELSPLDQELEPSPDPAARQVEF